MSIFDKPLQIVLNVVDTVSPSCGQARRTLESLPSEREELNRRMADLERELGDLRNSVETLNRDLDESRRLNLRAAELMDIAFTQLSK